MKRNGVIRELVRNRQLLLMFLPVATLLFLFNYLPLSGLIIPFKNFDFSKGIWGSDWMHPLLNNFDYILSSDAAFRAVRNTILLNALFIGVGLVFEVGFALMLNELRNKYFKRITQSLTFLPFFISWIVVGVFTYNLLNFENGALNRVLEWFGLQSVDFYSKASWWPLILTIAVRWKVTGYGTIVYLAALTSVDNSYYEAASIDGATRWQQMRFISIPMLKPTIMILTLLAIGRIMNADFGMFYAMVGDASLLFPTTDVIDTLVYRSLRKSGDIGMASAAGFLQSVVAFVLILASNYAARKVDRDSAIF
ncbi:ABC transporter permease [Paenibacillus sacheonensis]|uniref:ABC transporter permease subunit n=1 Tax=Paenibacillus sacheonensis TaxID=742054 RepID=A0A7X4YPU6_9BACL|nr:ABC transporter permease subunit [Paenibacillus sacheonensis]MBM7564943.1 putative aldouronate transport system permease protein [Paenibacillus sacheonensis]NBC70268.1 ABC transporter permease subunit [Paenibacillus sacheonensis]